MQLWLFIYKNTLKGSNNRISQASLYNTLHRFLRLYNRKIFLYTTSHKMTPQVTLPFLKMTPNNNQDFGNDPPTKCKMAAPPPPSQVINDQPLSSILYLL